MIEHGPYLFFAAALLTWTKKYIFVAAIIGAIIVQAYMVFLQPLLCARCERIKKPMPVETAEL